MVGGGEELSLTHPDPLVLELNHLQNQLKEKDRELGNAQAEIKALRATEVLKDKAIEELQNEVSKLDDKVRVTENVLDHKNLEIKKLTDEKKDALAAQYAAEATLRRVHASQKDDDGLPLESVIAPLEAEIKMYKNEITALQEDKKALERLTKSKESALLEAEKILKSAFERVLIVEEVQNQNFELRRQIEICLEENKILEKTNRQKVLEVEKLSLTIKELEEAILAGGAAANAIRDYKRQISELNEEKRTLERELARVKVLANRVASVVANEWKDENDKVMPVKQWLEERRILQAEMQRLKDKLAVSDRTAKAESQLKEKFKLRLKTLEEGLRQVPGVSVNDKDCGSPKPDKSSNILGFLTSNGRSKKRSTSQPRASSVGRSSLQQPNATAYGKGLWTSRNKVADSNEKENEEMKANVDANIRKAAASADSAADLAEAKSKEGGNGSSEDFVSGFLYDRLQKEVLNLRKYCEAKDNNLNAKDQEIKMLMKKVEAVTRAMEIESRKVRREAAAREKEAASTKMDDAMKKRSSSTCRRITKMA